MAEEAAPTADTGALSVEQATDALVARSAPMDVSEAARVLSQSRRKPEAAPVEAAGAEDAPEDLAPEGDGDGNTESEGETTPDDADDPDADPAIEGDEDGEPESDPAEPIIAAPKSWSAEDKAKWDAVPPEVKEVILAHEDRQHKATSKALQEAATARRAAEQEARSVGQMKPALESAIQRAETIFKTAPSVEETWAPVMADWAAFDWSAYAAEASPAEFQQAQAQFQQDQALYGQAQRAEAAQKAELASLKAAKEDADRLEFQSYVHTEAANLEAFATDPDHPAYAAAKDLTDPKEGLARKQAVGRDLLERGVPAKALESISAIELAVAYDAMRWRQAQATAGKAAPKPSGQPQTQQTKTPPAPAARTGPAPMRPTASAAARPTQNRVVAQADARFRQTGEVDDLVAKLVAKGQRK